MTRISFAGVRVITLVVVLLLILPTWATPALGAGGPPEKPDESPAAVPNELIVGFKDGTSEDARNRAVAAHGGQTKSANDRFDFHVVKVAPGRQVSDEVAAYRKDPAVRYAEPNYLYHTTLDPNDPRYTDGTLWGLNNTGQNGGTNDADIDAPEAWTTTTGSQGVVVGVVDTGIDYNHPDLAANVWSAPNGWTLRGCAPGTHGYRNDGTVSCDPLDDEDHGTHVSGTIGARGDNSTGVVGVNWNVQLMGLKFLDSGGFGSTDEAIDVIQYALEAKQAGVPLRVLNNSWGGGGFSQALYDAIAALNTAGILFVAAAGNGGFDGIGDDNDASPSYPASYDLPNIVAVAATDRQDQRGTFSNYGATSVDLGAPGVDITSTVRGNGYDSFSGTSMATPHVTGAAALLLAQQGAMTTLEMKQRLLYCGDLLTALNGITVSGRRLNAASALTCTVPTFTVTIVPTTGGTASVSPVLGSYPVETPITLTATPDAGFVFVGWQINGESRGGANPLTFPITEDLTIEPIFVQGAPFQYFDGVTTPTLPTGWAASRTGATCSTGDSGPWRTVTDAADTAPNAAFAGDPNCVSDNILQSPAFVVPNNSTRLLFRHTYNLEGGTSFFDGGVLEIAIGGGAFADILAAGGSFVARGYDGTLSTSFSNPLAGRQAWSGNSGGWVLTVVNLPPATAGQTVQLRWRVGTDSSVARDGWWVDSIATDPQVDLGPEPTVLSVAAASGTYGGTATLSATLTASGAGVAGKTIAFTIGGAASCGVSGTPACPATGGDGVATLPGASLAGQNVGTHAGAIGASFAGDIDFGASAGSADLTVTQAAQAITFAPLPNRVLGDPPFTAVATASSGLPVTFTAGPPTICIAGGANGATITLVAAGACIVTASQAGDANYLPATPVAQAFAIFPAPGKAQQTITFAPLPDKTLGIPPFEVTATASSGLPVSFTAKPSKVCTAGGTNGATITLVGVGTCTVTASQAGNAYYHQAKAVKQEFAVLAAAQVGQTNALDPLSDGTLSEAPFHVAAIAASSLPITFAAGPPEVCTSGRTTRRGSRWSKRESTQ